MFCFFVLAAYTLCLGPMPLSWAWGWRQAKVVSPEGEIKKIEWNEWELYKDPAKRDVGKTDEASYHIVRLQGVEPEHTHDTHDLVTTVLKGTGKIYFRDQSFDLQKGDVVHIPKGVPHWVENTGPEAMEAYAVFVPPFDGKDFHVTGNQPSPVRNTYENG